MCEVTSKSQRKDSNLDSEVYFIKKGINRKKVFLIAFFVVFCLVLSENVISRKHWERANMSFYYNDSIKGVLMNIEFFDFDFGPASENGYLEWCDFLFSADGKAYYYFMRAETDDQDHSSWSHLNMKNRLYGSKIQFNNTTDPSDGSFWSDSVTTQFVKVDNIGDKAYISMTWYLEKIFSNVKYIKVIGKWHVNGVWPHEYINGEVYDIHHPFSLVNKPDKKNNPLPKQKDEWDKDVVKVHAEADAIVVNGVGLGEIISVYSTAGIKFKSIVAKHNVIYIKLPIKQMYIVHIGQTQYKVTL